MAWPYDDEDIPPPPEGFTDPPDYSSGPDYTSGEGTDYTEGVATTWGYNDPMDDGTTAWGDNVNHPDAWGVSLSEQALTQQFGDPDAARGQYVEVTGPNGNTVVAPIVDKGPAPWVEGRQGPTIDVTEGVRREIGGTGMDAVKWRFIPPPPAGFEGGTELPQEQATTGGIPQSPAGFQTEGLNIQDAVDPSAPYMNRPRDPSSIKRIVMHGNVGMGFDELVDYGRHVDPERGFDPGYHFYIAKDGTIVRGAPVDRITNHTKGENSDSIGIVIDGADNGEMPTPAQEASAKLLVSDLGTQYGIDPQNVIGHGELQPGRREVSEGGNVASDIRRDGYFGGGVAAQELPPAPPGFQDETPQPHYEAPPVDIVRTEKAELAQKGLVEPGNIDLHHRQIAYNKDGSISTVRSMTIDEDGQSVLIPTVVDGKVVSNEAAYKHYKDTGEHLGKFENAKSADAYAENLHEQQAQEYNQTALSKNAALPAEPMYGGSPSPTPLQGMRPSYPPFTPENIRQGIPVHGWTPSPTPVGGVSRGPPEPPLARLAREGFLAAENITGKAYDAVAKKVEQLITPQEDPYVKIGDNKKAQEQATKDLPGLRDALRANQEVLTTYTGANMQESKPMLEALAKRTELQNTIHYAELASKGIFEPPKKPAVGPQLGEKESTWQDKLTAGAQSALPADQPQLASHATGVLTSWLREFTDERERYLTEHPGAVEKANMKAFDEAQSKTDWAMLDDMAAQMGLRNGKELKEVFRMLPRNIADADPATAGKWFIDALRDKSPTVAALAPGAGGLKGEGKSAYEEILAKRKADMAVYGSVSDWQDAKNSLIQGGTDQGVLMAIEGGYRMIDARTKDHPALAWLNKNAKSGAEETAKLREQIREGFPVEKSYADSFFGRSTQGVGQLLTMPAYLAPGTGQVMTVLQLYQEGREDYLNTRQQQGKPVDEKEADAAGWKYVSVAGVLEVAADKFIIGKYLKGAHEKGWSIAKTLREGGEAAVSESLSEGGQQAWLNIVAKDLQGYDPKRPFSQDVLDSVTGSLASGFLGGAGGHAAGAVAEGRQTEAARQDLIKAAQEWKAQQAPAGPAPGPLAGGPEAVEAKAAKERTGVSIPTAEAPAPSAAEAAPAAKPAEAPPEAAAPAPAAAPAKAKPTEIKSFAEMPEGLGKPVGGTAAPEPAAAAKTTPAAKVEAETEAEARALMEEQAGRAGAFAKAETPTRRGEIAAPDPNGKPPGIVRRVLSKVLGTSKQDAAEASYGKEYWRTQKLSSQEALNELGPHADSVTNSDITSKLGVKAEMMTDPADDHLVAYVQHYPDGRVVFKVNPRVMLAIHNSSGADGKALKRLMGEETTHAAETLMLRDEWQKAKADDAAALAAWRANPDKNLERPQEKAPGDFVDYTNRKASSMFSDMQNSVGLGPESGGQRKALYQAVKDAYNVYFTKNVQGGPKLKNPAGPKIFTEVFKRGPAHMSEFLSEFVRQAKQQRDQGNITESNWKKVMAMVKNWFTQALDRLNKALPGAYEGKFGPEVQEHLQKLDDFLKGKGAELPPIEEPRPTTAAQQKAGKAMKPAELAAEKLKPAKEKPTSQYKAPPEDVKLPSRAKSPEKMVVWPDSPHIWKQYEAAWKKGDWDTVKKMSELYEPGKADLIPKHEAPYKEVWDKGDWQGARAIQKESNKSTELILTPEKIDAMAKEGEAHRKWYQEFSAYLDDFLGPHKEYAPLIKEFLASTSPLTDIQGNVRKTVNEFLHYVETGEIKTGFKAHGDNLRRAVEGKMISGPKVGEYSPALHGDLFAATMDRHMFKIFFGNQNPTDAKQNIGADQLYRAAARLGWGVSEVQAAMWGAHLARRGENVSGAKVYGAFLEQERAKLEAVFQREAVHGGRGIETARRIAAGISARAGPEGALRQQAYAKAAEAEKRGEPTPKPIGLPRRPKETAEAEAARKGARGVVPPSPTPAPGGPDYGELRHPLHRRVKGMAQQLIEAGGIAADVGRRMLRHVDRAAALKGDWAGALPARGVLWKKSEAHRDFNKYWDTYKEKGQVAADALPMGAEGRRLVQESRDTVAKQNAEISRLGLKVYSNATGAIGPAPHINDFPDIPSRDTYNAIQNRGDYQAEWERLRDQMHREGIVSGATPDAVDTAAHIHAKAFLEDYDTNKQSTHKMPNMAFDRSLPGFITYTTKLADRAALKDAFGTKFVTPGGGAAGKNIFDLAKQRLTSEKLQSYVDLAQKYAYGTAGGEHYFTPLMNIGSATQYANLKSAAKNLWTGLVMNPVHMGGVNFVKTIGNLKGLFNAINDGKRMGVLLGDVANASYNEQGWTGKAAGFGIKYQAHNLAEKWSRGHGIMMAREYLRSAYEAFDKNPNSRASRQYMGRMKALGFSDPGALFREKGVGPLTETFIRRQVSAAQAGYSYAETPAFMSSATGKFTQQYGKYGTELATSIENHVLKPFVRQFGMKQETVTYSDAAGNKHTVKVAGEMLPLVRGLMIMGAAGAGWEKLSEWLFGTQSKYASWNEIFRKATRGDRQAIADAFGKVIHYYTDIGAAGFIGDKFQRGADVLFGKKTFEDAFMGIPSVQAVTKFSEIITDFFDRKDYDDLEGWKRLADKLSDTVSALRVGKEMAGAGMRHVNDIFGADYRFAEYKARTQDMGWVKSVNARADDALGVAPKPRFLGGTGATPESTMKESITNQLMLGNAYEAQHMLNKELKRFKDDEGKEDYLKKIKASVAAKQPLGEGAALRELRLEWAKKNLSPDQLMRYKKIDRDYRRTAEKAELMDDADKEPKEKDVEELRDRLKREAKQRQQDDLLRPAWRLLKPVTDPLAEGSLSTLRGTSAGLGFVTDKASMLFNHAYSGVSQ